MKQKIIQFYNIIATDNEWQQLGDDSQLNDHIQKVWSGARK